MFTVIQPEELRDNPFRMIGKDWLLLTATAPDDRFNSMTASWGGLGILWGKPVLYCFIRPQRYTHAFSEAGTRLTACVFSANHRPALNLCGKTSGRDTDKVKASGLTPGRTPDGSVYYQEARLVLFGRKLYTGQIDPTGFADAAVDENYPKKDYHTMYIYEIEEIWKAE